MFSKLCLEHGASLGVFVEEARPLDDPVVAELLGNPLGVGAFGTLLQEVVQEAKDLEVEAFQCVVLVVVQLLCNGVVVAL